MVAVASFPVADITNLNKPLSRLREVANRRKADTAEKRKIRAKQEEDLIAAEEALNRRIDGVLVSGHSQERTKDVFTFLVSILGGRWTENGLIAASLWKDFDAVKGDAEKKAEYLGAFLDAGGSVYALTPTQATRYVADFLGTNEGLSPRLSTPNRISHNTITGENHYITYIGRDAEGEPVYGVKPGNVTYGVDDLDEEEESYTVDTRDTANDRRSNFLYRMYKNEGCPGDDYQAWFTERTCKALIRGYRKFQSFAFTVQHFTRYPVPSLQTVQNAHICMDGDPEQLSYMETLERWLPEIIPVASSIFRLWEMLCMTENAADGIDISRNPFRPKRGTPIEWLGDDIIRIYTTIPNERAVSRAFNKRRPDVVAFLKERGVYQSHGGARKKGKY